jgi:hypothetical protein
MACEADLARAAAELSLIQESMDGTVSEKTLLEATLSTTQGNLKQATALISGLKGEKERWISQVGLCQTYFPMSQVGLCQKSERHT